MASKTQHDAVCEFSQKYKLHMLDCGGQVLFPIYSESGGLYSSQICYFTLASDPKWPEWEDMGRENKQPNGCLAAEIPYMWDKPQIEQHLEKLLALHKPAWKVVRHVESRGASNG